MPNILSGDIEAVGRSEREMGHETIYSAKLYGKCMKCGNSMEAEVSVYEYPPGVINSLELERTKNCKYSDIGNLDNMIDDVIRTVLYREKREK